RPIVDRVPPNAQACLSFQSDEMPGCSEGNDSSRLARIQSSLFRSSEGVRRKVIQVNCLTDLLDRLSPVEPGKSSGRVGSVEDVAHAQRSQADRNPARDRLKRWRSLENGKVHSRHIGAAPDCKVQLGNVSFVQRPR